MISNRTELITQINNTNRLEYTVDKPTVIVTDQASIHTSDAMFGKTEEWLERNITIFELPTYIPLT